MNLAAMVRRILALLTLPLVLIPSAVAQVNVTGMYRSLTAGDFFPPSMFSGANSPSNSLTPSFQDSLSFNWSSNPVSGRMGAGFGTAGDLFVFSGAADFSRGIGACDLFQLHNCEPDGYINIKASFFAVFTLESTYNFDLTFEREERINAAFSPGESFFLRSGGNLGRDSFGNVAIVGGTQLLTHSLGGPNATGALGPGSYSLAYLSQYDESGDFGSDLFDGEFFSQMNLRFTPAIPEPETYAMLLVGLALLGFEARRGRRAKLA